MYLSDIKRDDRFEGYLIVRSAEQRASANGKNYLDMTLADKSGSINAKMWDGTVQPPLAGSIVKVRATGNEFNGRMQLRVEKIRAAESRDQVDMSALIPCAPRDPNEMLGEVVRAADHIADPDLRRITCELLDRAGDKLLTFPAAKQMHHAERSGLLHHTTTMLRAANAIMSVYPQLNASLLIAGVIVHDLAKIDEMDADTLGLVSDYSVDGKLIGHIVRGVVNIQLAAEKTKANPGKALLLQHMVLSTTAFPNTAVRLRRSSRRPRCSTPSTPSTRACMRWTRRSPAPSPAASPRRSGGWITASSTASPRTKSNNEETMGLRPIPRQKPEVSGLPSFCRFAIK